MVALHTTAGLVQYADSAEAMLASYNDTLPVYELRATESGEVQIWHKGHRRAVGVMVEVS